MIVVNNPGTWARVYPPLLHADWHGWTPTDTIFPFFLFIVGVSMAFSFARRRSEGSSRATLSLHTLRRAAIIFGLGLALNLLSFFLFHRAALRIPGVLQRIGICFLFAALIFLWLGTRGVVLSAAALLLLYWALMALVPVPGYGAGRLDLEGNLAAHVDRQVLGAHTWKPGWDPEGPLSTLPAIATTLLGVCAGVWQRDTRRKATVLLAAGSLAAFLGHLWGLVFPINKNIWTSSYALFMSGLAAVGLALCLWLVDVHRRRAWAAPLLWLGTNAIAVFVLSTLTTILLLAIKVAGAEDKPRSLYAAIYRTVFDRFIDPRLGSLLFALAHLALWLGVAGLLYRRRIFIRV